MEKKLGKYKEGDFIINRDAGDMAIVSKIDKKGYYHFKRYYDAMFKYFKENIYILQVNYEKFFEPMTDDEIKEFEELIEKEK